MTALFDSDTIFAYKSPFRRTEALRIAMHPTRGGASGALIMPKDIPTDDRYEMRPIDVELYEICAKGTHAQRKFFIESPFGQFPTTGQNNCP